MRAILIAVGLMLSLCRSAPALEFALNFDASIDAYPAARAGIEQAAALWQALFTDPATLRINARIAPQSELGFSSLATYFYTQDIAYTTVRDALVADVHSADDAVAVAHLPQAPPLSFRTRDAQGNIVVNSGQQLINTHLDVPKGTARALGLPVAIDGRPDAEIAVNQLFLDFTTYWDFDRTDGIQGVDFIGVAAQGLGHAMGFHSGVDYVDYFSLPNGPEAPEDLNEFAIANPLDLFRFTAESLPLFDLAPGGAPYFSIDGGVTNLGPLANGAYHGNGDQASHWGGAQGIMAPSFGENEVLKISALDRQFFDVIGWDLRPVVPGDFDHDGALTGADVQAMLTALVDLPAYKTAGGLTDGELVMLGDLDGDTAITNADLQSLLNLLITGAGALVAVPEPSTASLLLCAALIFACAAAGKQTSKRLTGV